LIAFSVVALAAIGCGGTGGDDTTTVTTDDMAAAGPDLAGAHLQSGMYTVSKIVKVSDGCNLGLESGFGPVLVTNTGTMLSVGNACNMTGTIPTCNPAGYLEGTGTYTDSSHATLTLNTMVTLADSCTYTKMVTSKATFTGMNKLSLDFTDTESGYSAMCTVDEKGTTDPCTSEYTFDLAM
jgi:hypothetical protein